MLARWVAGASFDADGLDRALLDPATRRHVQAGDRARGMGLVRDDDRVAFRADLAAFFADHDVLLTPVLARPPVAAGGRSCGSAPR